MSEYALILKDRVLVYTEHKYALEVYNSLKRKDIQILPVNRVIVRDSASYIEKIMTETDRERKAKRIFEPSSSTGGVSMWNKEHEEFANKLREGQDFLVSFGVLCKAINFPVPERRKVPLHPTALSSYLTAVNLITFFEQFSPEIKFKFNSLSDGIVSLTPLMNELDEDYIERLKKIYDTLRQINSLQEKFNVLLGPE